MFKNLPWLRTATRFAASFNFICDHQKFCHPRCFDRIQRQSHKLMVALRKVRNGCARSSIWLSNAGEFEGVRRGFPAGR